MKITKSMVSLVLVAMIGCDGKSDRSDLDASGLDARSRPPVREGVLGPLPVVEIRIGEETFTIEIADEERERQQGLMYRKSMPSQHGMIFVWPDAEPRSFWMKDTELPLDLVYLDHSGKVVAILTGRPFDRTPIFSKIPAQYVIELEHGTGNRLGLKLGDVIELPDTLR